MSVAKAVNPSIQVVRLANQRGVSVVDAPIKVRKSGAIDYVLSQQQFEEIVREAYAIGYEDGAKDAMSLVNHINDGDDQETAAQKVIDAYRLGVTEKCSG